MLAVYRPYIVSDFREIISLSNEALRQSLCDLLQSRNIEESVISDVNGVIDNPLFDQDSEHLNTISKRNKYY